MASRPLCPRVLVVPLLVAAGAVEARDTVIEEITVTAQKRTQSAFDVPITLSALSGDDLATLGIEEFDRLSDFVPGLVVQEQSVNNPGFVIRGITSDSGSAQIAPRVSIYQDGVDISRSRGSIVELFDLERVEVLKGPQATLFGSGASIGAISVVSARPTDTFEAAITGGAGNLDHRQVSGFVSGPLVADVLRGRLAWIAKERDGYVDNLDGSPGSRNPRPGSADALNGTDTRALRASLNWTPTDALDVDLIVNWQKDEPPGTAFKSGTLPTARGSVDPNEDAELGPFSIQGSPWLGGTYGIDREVWGVTLQGDLALDDTFSLASITAYRTFESLEVFDADGTPALWLEFAEDARGEQWSQELRLDIDPGGAFSGFVGASLFHEEGQQRVPFETDEGVFAACSAGACFAPDGSIASILPVPAPYRDVFGNTGDFDTFSVYGDVTWDATPTLAVTAGLRWITEERRAGAFALGTPSLLTGGVAPLLPFGDSDGALLESDTEDFDDWVPRLLVSWTPTETLNLYASAAKGRRSNIVDASVTAAGDLDVTVLPKEEIWSFETGFKSRLADGRVSLDGAVFYQDYADFQTSIVDAASGEIVPVTAGTATNIGVETTLTAQLSETVRLFVTGGWLDAQFDDEDDDGNDQVFGGNRFRLQPEWTASVALDGRRPLTAGLDLLGTATWTYRSSVFFADDNAPVAGLDIAEDAVDLVSLRLGVAARDDRWQVMFEAENLLDREYTIDAGNTGGAFGTPTVIGGPPRLWSLEASWRL
jgi:outer membrane receptor protein involved in Fe transport